MTDLVVEQLRRLAGTLAVLHGRVREAVAGEVGKAVADAVAEVLTVALGGHSARPGGYGGRAPAYGRADWDDPDATGRGDGYGRPSRPAADGPTDPPISPDAPAAVAVAVAAGRWWLGRRGSTWQAAGITMAAGAALLGGGPVARAALAVLWAAHRLRTATAALGDGARALDRV
jgi:hypothetical protein